MTGHRPSIWGACLAAILLAGCASPGQLASSSATQTPVPATAVRIPTASPTPAWPSGPADPSSLRVTYTCNTGFILSSGGKTVLVDALFQEPRIHCVPDAQQAAVMAGADLVLVSHAHPDHFDPQLVGAYLRANPQAQLVCGTEVVEELRTRFAEFEQIQSRVRPVQLVADWAVLNVAGIALLAISMPADVPNLAFVVRIGGYTLFHSGDWSLSRDTVKLFQACHLVEQPIDVAFVQWSALAEEWYRPIVEEGIRAQRYVPMHWAGERDAKAMLRKVTAAYPSSILLNEAQRTWVYWRRSAAPGDAAAPAGGRIAFASKRDDNDEVYVVNADGANLQRLTRHPAEFVRPAWSPDGRQLAFQANLEGQWDIFTVNADGTGRTRLTDNPADDVDPDWGPQLRRRKR